MKKANDLIASAALLETRAADAREKYLRDTVAAALRDLETERERSGIVAAARKYARELPAVGRIRKGRARTSDRRPAAAFAAFSDWHVEEIVDPRKVQGMNEYNPRIAQLRSARAFAGVEWLIREQQSMFAIDELLLWLGGDFISGYIHEELVEANAMSPTRAMLFAQKLLTAGIRKLLAETQLTIRIACNFGNHGRTTLKRRIATAADNSFEYLMYLTLAESFSNEPRVKFQVCEGLHHVAQIYDLRLHMHHGDDVRSLGGIGGVQVPLKRAAIQWHQKFNAHMSVVGHFHEYNPGETFMMNGSLIGYGMYSDSLAGAQNRPPVQIFCLFDHKRGKTQCAPLWVSEK